MPSGFSLYAEKLWHSAYEMQTRCCWVLGKST